MNLSTPASDVSFLLADVEETVGDVLAEVRTTDRAALDHLTGPDTVALDLEAMFENISEETFTDLDLWSTMQLIPVENTRPIPIVVLPPVRTFVRPHEDKEEVPPSTPVEYKMKDEQRVRLRQMR